MLIKSCGINASSRDTLAAVLQRFIFIAKDDFQLLLLSLASTLIGIQVHTAVEAGGELAVAGGRR